MEMQDTGLFWNLTFEVHGSHKEEKRVGVGVWQMPQKYITAPTSQPPFSHTF